MSELKGSCHCGAIRITVPGPPEQILQCNCSLCRKTGWIGGFWDPEDVKITADPDMRNNYVQGDKTITVWNCRRCGMTSYWTPLTAPPERMGVNMRLFEPEGWAHLPVRHVDGASL